MENTQLTVESATQFLPLRSLPTNSYLVHATNCVATWGAGIAAELADIFPAACLVYKRFCNAAKPSPSTRWPPRSLAGRCLIIPPQKADIDAGAPSVHIVCLFASYGFGRPNPSTGKPGKDAPGQILAQTEASLREFREQLETNVGNESGIVIYSNLFNSGAFQVTWGRTEALIKTGFAGWNGRWIVLAPPP
ncbi:ADP-ribose 1''-phosphate phosphatase [Cladobotryum mycophilum]|uniref:ADP-ribose 1''-phosphate phosphatase n=1 Tax=Cladobotryum mycophilum TaxID=491253 RepID=A0ABR0T4E6_9HYPO